MYTVKVDPHTHTLFSGHAFSTIGENLAQAAKKGLTGLGMSEHYSPAFLPLKNGVPDFGPMLNMSAMPKVVDGVRVLASVEIDIVDFQGHVACWDLAAPFGREGSTVAELLLGSRDYAIASVHAFPGWKDGTFAQYTDMYLKVLQNPGIQIIGHPCRPGFRFDMDEVVRAAKREGKLLEINNHTMDFPGEITGRCRQLALKCAQEGTSIVVSSDAHSAWYVGEFGPALQMLEEIHFPQELIANRSLESFLAAVGKA